MEVPIKKKYSLLKKMGLLALVLFMVGLIWVWYVLTEKYSDTKKFQDIVLNMFVVIN